MLIPQVDVKPHSRHAVNKMDEKCLLCVKLSCSHILNSILLKIDAFRRQICSGRALRFCGFRNGEYTRSRKKLTPTYIHLIGVEHMLLRPRQRNSQTPSILMFHLFQLPIESCTGVAPFLQHPRWFGCTQNETTLIKNRCDDNRCRSSIQNDHHYHSGDNGSL